MVSPIYSHLSTYVIFIFRLEQVLSRQSEKKAEEVKLLEEESSRQHSCIQELEKVSTHALSVLYALLRMLVDRTHTSLWCYVLCAQCVYYLSACLVSVSTNVYQWLLSSI